MTIKIDMLRTFATVADCGNLADAANRLGRTPSAVSMMLKQLEDHLGKPLFKTDRKNQLSRVGVFVFEQAQRELQQFDRTISAIENYATAGAGTVHIAAVPSVAGTILPNAFASFTAAHPKVQITLHDMDSARVLQAFSDDRIDIAIATLPAGFHTDDRTPLLRDAFGLVCRRDHPLAAKPVFDWADIADTPFIANALCATIPNATFQNIYRRATLHVQSTLSLLAMVHAGLGVTVLPRMAAMLHPETLHFCAARDPHAQRQIDLLQRSKAARAPAAAALADHILAANPSGNPTANPPVTQR